MAEVILSFGSNLGNRQQHLEESVRVIAAMQEYTLSRISSIYETSPVGGPKQDDFLNMAIAVTTDQIPENVLADVLSIEKKMGRERSGKNFPRTIDIDILFYDACIIQKAGMHIPHPRLHERLFVLIPLCDIMPNKIHPVFGKTIGELKEMYEPTLRMHQKVYKRDEIVSL